MFWSSETSPAPRAGDGEVRVEDSGGKELWPSWEPGEPGKPGYQGNLGNLQLLSCRSHAVSSSGFSISSYSDTLQCVSFRSRRSPHVFWCKGEAGRPGGTPAGQLLVLLEQRLGNPAGSGTPAMQGRPATQPCARDRWKLTVFFGTEIFMGQEPHGSSQWPWI